METNTKKRRLAYRIADWLPQPIRVIYYILLFGTLVYLIYRIIAGLLSIIQHLGAFIFEKKTFYTLFLCLVLIAVGILLASQFIWGLDPIGKAYAWILEQYERLKEWLISFIEGSGY